MQSDDFITVGKVNGFHGVKGYVKVFSETRPRGAILQYQRLYLKKGRNGEWREVVVADGREQSKNIVLRFDGYESRNDAELLLGAELAITRQMLPPLDQDNFYWVDLLKMEVYNEEGEYLGVIDDILETGANDVLVIRNPKIEHPYLIPYGLNQTVTKVDLENRMMHVIWDSADY